MKNTFKRSLAALTAVAMLVSLCCLFTGAATFSLVPTGMSGNADENVSYAEYNISSCVADGHTELAYAMTFDPSDGYYPMAFSGTAGYAALLDEHYDVATEKYGYDVLGVINGSFFGMDYDASYNTNAVYGNYGTLVGLLISGGKVYSAHNGYTDSVVAFDKTGRMDIVNSNLSFSLSIKGTTVPNGLYYINKTSGFRNSGWSDRFYYFDTSCGDFALTFASCPGYEVVCKKSTGSDLRVGETLSGTVKEIRTNSYSANVSYNPSDASVKPVYSARHELAEDEFIIFVKNGSSYVSYINGLTVGDSINVGCTETISGSVSVMKNADSVLSNVGWLVKNGVDQTYLYSDIGTHHVTETYARWTAFGVKADGSYVFFTTEGGSTGNTSRSVTLRDVAKAMIELGCVNVIRMDGGGSTGMYVKDNGSGAPGFVQVSTRPVADCIMIVRDPDHAPEAPVQPEELVSLPSGAIPVGHVGFYYAGGASCITKVNTEMTVGEFSAIFCEGVAKDLNYYGLVICNSKGIIDSVNFTLGRPAGVKTNVIIPADSIVIAYHGDNYGYSLLSNSASVGKKVNIYNIIVENTASLTEIKPVTDAGITVQSVGKGDINADGRVNAKDYLLAKRAVLGTYTVTAGESYNADVNGNGSFGAEDYLLIKRSVLGTYTING